MARKTQKKHSIKQPIFSNFYIPPFYDFMEFLQIPSGPIAISKILSSQHGITLDVSRSSLGKLNNEGVGPTTWKKIVKAVNPVLKQVEISVWIIREAMQFSKIRSNYASWIGVIRGMKAHNEYKDDDNILLYTLINFLEERSQLQKKAKLPAQQQQQQQQQQLEISFPRKTTPYSRDYHTVEAILYRSHSLIPNKVIDDSLPILVKGLCLEEISSKNKKN